MRLRTGGEPIWETSDKASGVDLKRLAESQVFSTRREPLSRVASDDHLLCGTPISRDMHQSVKNRARKVWENKNFIASVAGEDYGEFGMCVRGSVPQSII